jgi:hypothetical protein
MFRMAKRKKKNHGPVPQQRTAERVVVFGIKADPLAENAEHLQRWLALAESVLGRPPQAKNASKRKPGSSGAQGRVRGSGRNSQASRTF